MCLAHATKLLWPSQVRTFKLGRLVAGSSSLWLLIMPWYLEGHPYYSEFQLGGLGSLQLGPACRKLCHTLESPPPNRSNNTHADQLAVCGRTYSSSRRSGLAATAPSMAAGAKNIEIKKTKSLDRRVFVLNDPVDTTQLSATRIVKCAWFLVGVTKICWTSGVMLLMAVGPATGYC
jgi:hypothetical protein